MRTAARWSNGKQWSSGQDLQLKLKASSTSPQEASMYHHITQLVIKRRTHWLHPACCTMWFRGWGARVCSGPLHHLIQRLRWRECAVNLLYHLSRNRGANLRGAVGPRHHLMQRPRGRVCSVASFVCVILTIWSILLLCIWCYDMSFERPYGTCRRQTFAML